MQVAVLGLTKNGRLIVEKLLSENHDVIVWDRAKEPLEAIRTEKAEFIVNQKLIIVHTLEELQNFLRKPRIIWCMQETGEPTETTLSQINQFTESGDVVIDGGDTYFKDTNRHFEDFEKKGVRFLGIGIAGGVHAYENGACLMIGGDQDGYQYIIPLLDAVTDPEGTYTYFGTGGAGHFVKMVHDGVEYGMTQAISEGIGLLSRSEYSLNIQDVVDTWQEGGITSSFLLDMVTGASVKDPGFSQNDGQTSVEPTAKWMVDLAKANSLPISVTEQAVQFRDKSKYDKAVQETTVAKVVKAIKKEIGG
jgi:6-phosphogluconate dehydrogenase